MSATVDAGPGWRLLAQADVMQQGDEVAVMGGAWELVAPGHWGKTWCNQLYFPTRRRIAQPAPVPPSGSLVERILALPCDPDSGHGPCLTADWVSGYKYGHQDTRRAAAELAGALDERVAHFVAALVLIASFGRDEPKSREIARYVLGPDYNSTQEVIV